MAQIEIPNSVKDFIKWSPEICIELTNAFINLWSEGAIFVESREDGTAVYASASMVDKMNVKGIDKKDLGNQIPSIVDVIQYLIHSVRDKKLIESSLKFSKQDSDKLFSLWDRLEKEEILQEIDYRFHSSIPHIDLKQFDYDIRIISPAHFDGDTFATTHLSFVISEGVDKKHINFEATRNDVRVIIKKLQEAEKEIERTKTQYNKVKET